MFILGYLIMLVLSANGVIIPGIVSTIIIVGAALEGLIYLLAVVLAIITAIRER